MRTLAFVLLAACAACSDSTPVPSTPKTSTPAASAGVSEHNVVVREDVSTEAFAKLREEPVLLIDVRTTEEFASGHVPGAINVPINQLAADKGPLAGRDKSEPVFFICQSGGRSARAADAMAKEGYRTVNVLGGTASWKDEGRPVE